MRVTRQLSRRLAVGVALAASAFLLPAAAGASSAAAGSAARNSQSAVRCSTSAWYGLPGTETTLGTFAFEIQLSNIGRTACTYLGFARVQALNKAGVAVGKPATHIGSRKTVRVAAGATAHFVLTVANAFRACRHPVLAKSIEVFPPGRRAAILLPLATHQCAGKSVMKIDAVHPQAGIPGFSAS